MSLDSQPEPVTNVLAPYDDVDWSGQLKQAYGFRVVDQEGNEAGEIPIYDGQKVHLRQTKSEVRALGWDKTRPRWRWLKSHDFGARD